LRGQLATQAVDALTAHLEDDALRLLASCEVNRDGSREARAVGVEGGDVFDFRRGTRGEFAWLAAESEQNVMAWLKFGDAERPSFIGLNAPIQRPAALRPPLLETVPK